jgi:hypothetical protein
MIAAVALALRDGMARVTWGVAAAVLAAALTAGCMSSSQRVARVLRGTGIATVTFGQSPTFVVAGIARYFGRPSSASASAASRIGLFRAGCGFGEIIWAGLAARSSGSNSDGLTVYFRRSRFVGYSYGPPYGGPRAPAIRHGLMLSTSKGLGLDEALARGRRLYGRAFTVTSQAEGTPPNPRLVRLPLWEVRTASGRIYGYIDSPGGPLSSSDRTIGSISAGAVPNISSGAIPSRPCR